MNYLSNIARSEGDPKVLSTGPSSLATADKLGKALGWFSIGLGLTELVAARRLTRALGMEGHETLVRAYGAREIGSGILSLSTEKHTGLWSRVAGDGLDIATLMTAMRPDNPKRDNVRIALAMVVGVTLLDIAAAQAFSARHGRGRGRPRSYRDRTGFPQGVQAARGAARDFRVPEDMRATPDLAAASNSPAEERPRMH
jgi:hypothetical protein